MLAQCFLVGEVTHLQAIKSFYKIQSLQLIPGTSLSSFEFAFQNYVFVDATSLKTPACPTNFLVLNCVIL